MATRAHASLFVRWNGQLREKLQPADLKLAELTAVLELIGNGPRGAHITASRLTRTRKLTVFYCVGIFGFAARIALWCVSEGTNDIRTWLRFAREIQSYGLGPTYRLDPLFNHPPLMGLLASATLLGSSALDIPFHRAFKLYGLLAEVGIALLLMHIWRRRQQPEQAVLAFAGYGCALCAILISGYHGNTDPVYWFLVLSSVYVLEDRKAPLLAGLLMGVSLQVKLIPMLVVLPMAACCRELGKVVRYLLGVAVALAPFAWIVWHLVPIDREAFVRNVLGYTSYREFWGAELVLRAVSAATLTSLPAFASKVETVGAFWALIGSKALLGVTSMLAAAHAVYRYKGLDAYAIAALCFCLFLVLASGFGVQYMGAVVPFLLACRIRDGIRVATASGVFIGLIYLSFIINWSPIFSQHSYFSAAFAVPSFITWWLIVRAATRLWRVRNWPVPHHQ